MKKQAEEAHFAQLWCDVSPFRMNTCKSASKQRTLTLFRMNTYEKQGGGVVANQKSRRVDLHPSIVTASYSLFPSETASAGRPEYRLWPRVPGTAAGAVQAPLLSILS